MVTLRAKGEIGQEGLACRVETGRALVEAGLHPATGGTGLQACSGDMLLEALAACAGVTLSAVATALGHRDPAAARSRPRATSTSAARSASPRTRRSASAPSASPSTLDTDADDGAARDAAQAHRALLRRPADPAHPAGHLGLCQAGGVSRPARRPSARPYSTALTANPDKSTRECRLMIPTSSAALAPEETQP